MNRLNIDMIQNTKGAEGITPFQKPPSLPVSPATQFSFSKVVRAPAFLGRLSRIGYAHTSKYLNAFISFLVFTQMHIDFVYCSAVSFLSLNDVPWEHSLTLISSCKTIASPLLEGCGSDTFLSPPLVKLSLALWEDP